MNCLIPHRIDTKLYILQKKRQQVRLNAVESVAMSVELAVGFLSSFPSCPLSISRETQPDGVFLKKSAVWWFCFRLFFFFFFFFFLLCVSVVHFRNQRCRRPSFSSLSQTNCSHPHAVTCRVVLDTKWPFSLVPGRKEKHVKLVTCTQYSTLWR